MPKYTSYSELTEKEKIARREAVNRYSETVDRINVRLPKGTKERIYSLTGMSCAEYGKQVILKDLDRLEAEQIK